MDTSAHTAQPVRLASLASERGFLVSCALLFITNAGAAIYWASSIAAGWPLPAGQSTWMPGMAMPAQDPLVSAASFMGMWVVMMAAMMLPSLVPTLLRYRSFLRAAGQARLATRTALAGMGYFVAWAAFGAVAYLLGLGFAAAQMRWMDLARMLPIAGGVALLLAGVYQFSSWKFRQLACCREEAGSTTQTAGAWQYGLRLGLHGTVCCLGFIVVWLVAGTMNLGAMALVASAITLERLGPRPALVARALGIAIILVGIFLTAHVIGVV